MTLLLLAAPYIPAFICVAVSPAVEVAHSAVDVEFFAVAGVFSLTAAPTAADLPSATGVSNVSGVHAVACVPAVVDVPAVPWRTYCC